jgi:hypothetical protein
VVVDCLKALEGLALTLLENLYAFSHDSLALAPDGQLPKGVELRPPKKRGALYTQDSEVARNNRIEALKTLLLALMGEIESLRGTDAADGKGGLNLSEEVRRYEADLIRCALIRTGGRQRQAAHLLQTKVATLNAKVKRYGLDADELVALTSSHRRRVK